MELNITVADNCYTGVLVGNLDTIAASQFTTDMQPLIDNADKQIELDFSQLLYISSSGLRCLLTLRKEVAKKGGSLVLHHINDDLKKIFTITGFYSLFDIRA